MGILPVSAMPYVSPHVAAHLASLASLAVASLWQGVLLTAAVALSLRLLPGLSAGARSVLWTAVLLLIVALPWWPSAAVAAGNGGRASVWHLQGTVSLGIVGLWSAVSLVRLSQLLGNALWLVRVVRQATPVRASEAVAAMLAGGSRHIRLCTSGDVDRPSVAGFLRPRILLPPTLLPRLSEAELVQIVLHEAEHLRRFDDWINLLQGISLALFPLNPALFWLNRRLSLERELACDDGVLRRTGARKAYAACLAHVAEHSLVRGGLSLALGMLGDWIGRRGRGPELSRRVERILSQPAPVLPRPAMRAATGLLCLGLVGSAGLLARSPQLVSFTPAARDSAGSDLARSVPAHAFALPISRRTAEHPVFVRTAMPLPGRPSRGEAVVRRRTKLRAPHRLGPAGARHLAATRAQGLLLARADLGGTAQPFAEAAKPFAEGAGQPRPATIAPESSEPLDNAPPQLTPVLFRYSPAMQGWYAAVPVRGGWLFLQL